MRLFALLTVAALLATGCGGTDGPATVTPEMEAEQRQAEQQVRNEESRMLKQQKMPKGRQRTEEQRVFDEEFQRQQQGR